MTTLAESNHKKQLVDGKCSDCGFAAMPITLSTLNKGSTVREPGEFLCAPCNSVRMRLVRQVMAMPADLGKIRASRGGFGPKDPGKIGLQQIRTGRKRKK